VISAWWLVLIIPAAYAGFVYANGLWIKSGYRPKRANPYKRASHPPSPATGADNRTTTHTTPETGAGDEGESA
jgi:hypothetical protein